MKKDKYKLTDLGQFESVFLKIVKKYGLDESIDIILKSFFDVILNEIDDIKLTNVLRKKLKLGLVKASDFTYELKKEILDNPEINKIKENIDLQVQEKFTIESITKDILAKLPEFPISNPNTLKRFQSAIESWFIGIRDVSGLKETLERPEKVGGIGMTSEAFNHIYDLLKDKQKEMKELGIDLSKDKKEMSPDKPIEEPEIDVESSPIQDDQLFQEKITENDVTIDKILKEKGVNLPAVEKSIVDTNLVEAIEEKEEFLESREEIPPPPPVIIQLELDTKPKEPLGSVIGEDDFNFKKDEDRDFNEKPIDVESKIFSDGTQEDLIESEVEESPSVKPLPVESVIEEMSGNNFIEQQTLVQATPEPIDRPIIDKSQIDRSSRPRVEDVKFTPKLYGPVDELAAFTLDDFRRLSDTPEHAIEKIITKLDLLEDDSIVKRVEGIRALKNSPLYKAYADIMNQSMMAGKPIQEIINQAGSLKIDEFKAIMDLNKMLKY